jgi:uncharacterized protein (DUF1499 family)
MTEPAAAHDNGPKHKKARIVFLVVLAIAIVATFAGEKMGFITNVATDQRFVEASPEKALNAVRAAAAAMPRWTLTKDDGRVLEWEARTALIGFVDDVRVELVADGSGTQLRLRSASRTGLSDLGTNGRCIRAFLALVDEKLKST